MGAGGDPWIHACPSERFAVALHGFGWAHDLIAGEAGVGEALRLWLAWRRAFGRFNAFAWAGEALERRVFNLACAAPALCAIASEAEATALLASLARQARHLLTVREDPARALDRCVAAAVAGAALAGKAGEQLLRRALPRVERLAPLAILPDGVHAGRAPQRGLELLLDLQALDDALSLRGRPAPVELSRAIDRLTGATRFFTLADGRLAAFQGGEPSSRARVAAALALDESAARTRQAAADGGYHRLVCGQIELMVDAGAPAAGIWSLAACAQPAALEVVLAGRRVISGAGWSPVSPGSAGVLRLAGGASCLGLGGGSPGAPLGGLAARALGPRLADAPAKVSADRRETADALWLDITHDGWNRDFGLAHTRRLFVDIAAEELRGEDLLSPVGPPRNRRLIAYNALFYLTPEVSASVAMDGKSVLLRPGLDPGWRLRSDATEVFVEPTTVFENGEARRGQVIILRGHIHLNTSGRVRWKLSRADA